MDQRRFSVQNQLIHIFEFTTSKKRPEGRSISMTKHEIKISSRTAELVTLTSGGYF